MCVYIYIYIIYTLYCTVLYFGEFKFSHVRHSKESKSNKQDMLVVFASDFMN